MPDSVIYKYQITDEPIEMPRSAAVLHVGLQANQWILWALLPNKKAVKVARTFVVIGTGQEFDNMLHRYIGTFQQPPYVWHVFEVGR